MKEDEGTKPEQEETKVLLDEDGEPAPYGLCYNGDGKAALEGQGLCYDCYIAYRWY